MERAYLEELIEDYDLIKIGSNETCCALESTDSGQGTVQRSCEYGNEPMGSIKGLSS